MTRVALLLLLSSCVSRTAPPQPAPRTTETIYEPGPATLLKNVCSADPNGSFCKELKARAAK